MKGFAMKKYAETEQFVRETDPVVKVGILRCFKVSVLRDVVQPCTHAIGRSVLTFLQFLDSRKKLMPMLQSVTCINF